MSSARERGSITAGGFSTPEREVPAIEVTGVSYFFGSGENRAQVLFDNNLRIYPGEVVIMTGPSGSGKTTMLTLIAALRSLQAGSLKLFGGELKGLTADEAVKVRRNIGFIFQTHNLFESLTAYENVKLATELHNWNGRDVRRTVIDMLTAVGLGERISSKPDNLSVGQKQRVAIARALVNRPRIVLADEPTAALDKTSGRMVVDILHNMAKRENCTVLIVTHDNRILDIADRIVSMVDGHITSDVEVNESLAKVEFLKKCKVFENSSACLLADVADRTRPEKAAAGVEVISQGDIGDKFYIVKSGSLEVMKEETGQVKAVARLEAGDFFGELALLFDQPRTATVRTLEEVELLALSKDDFLTAVAQCQSFREQLRRVYFQR